MTVALESLTVHWSTRPFSSWTIFFLCH